MTKTLPPAATRAPAELVLVRSMTRRLLATLLSSLLLVRAVDADVGAQKQGWEKKVIGNVRIEAPTDCKTDVQKTPGIGGAVRKMMKFSFRTHMLDVELVFLSYASGTVGNLDKAAGGMSSEIKRTLGEKSLTPWKTTTVSGRPARYMATKPSRTHEARQITLIDDIRADVSYGSTSMSAKGVCERIMKSVELR